MTERHRPHLGIVTEQEPFVDEYGLKIHDFRTRPPAMTEDEFRLAIDRRLRAIEIVLETILARLG